ncbi:hypothetical protein, partial [Nostoc sp. UIC 10630]|uniref:hypothetical protein n=1 Tax=Nostoc sp. UIC 10630 TaxID=2100146 RepID=UPI001A9C9AF7
PLTDSQRQSSYAKLTQDLKIVDNSQQPRNPVAVAQTRLLPMEQLSPLTDSQRQLSYIKLAQDLQRFGK